MGLGLVAQGRYWSVLLLLCWSAPALGPCGPSSLAVHGEVSDAGNAFLKSAFSFLMAARTASPSGSSLSLRAYSLTCAMESCPLGIQTCLLFCATGAEIFFIVTGKEPVCFSVGKGIRDDILTAFTTLFHTFSEAIVVHDEHDR